MGFQWDLEKDAANRAKHLLSFRQAAEIFRGFRLTRADTRRDYGERRYISLGEYDGQVVKVVYTLRDGDIASSQPGRRADMTGMPMPRRVNTVRFDGLDDMPPAEPLSEDFKALSDTDVERRASEDVQAGLIPPGFWDEAQPVEPEGKEQITLRLDTDVLRHFREGGKGYQSRINAVLRSYVQAKQRA